MSSNFSYSRRVEFADTDAAGILHFANFFRYMEEAEHAYLRSIGLSVHTQKGGETISWPRVNAECKFEAPLRFEDEVNIKVSVIEKKRKTLKYKFDFELENKTIATGYLIVVCVSINNNNMKSILIPDWIAEKIKIQTENS